MDKFVDYVAQYSDETIQAFLYLKDVPDGHVMSPSTDAPFYKIPAKNRMEAGKIYEEYKTFLGKAIPLPEDTSESESL